MRLEIAELVVAVVEGYVACGLLVALPFVVRGVDHVDPLASAARWPFRLLILPGCVSFWPLLLVRWVSGSVAPPVELNPHRLRARRQR